MKHVIQTTEQGYPVTLIVYQDAILIDDGGYEQVEVDRSAIPALIQALQAIHTELQEARP